MAAFAPTAPLRATAFLPAHHRPAVTSLSAPLPPPPPRRAATITMRSDANLAVKRAKVDAVKGRLENTLLLFNAELDGLTVSEVATLKRAMPQGTTIGTVKNKLMRRAIVDSDWAIAEPLTKTSSFWVFVESDMKGSVEAYSKFIKELKREAPIRGGVFDGELLDGDSITAVSKMPTKQELMQKVAVSVKMVQTKIAKSIKLVPTRVAKVVKLAVADDASDPDAPAAE